MLRTPLVKEVQAMLERYCDPHLIAQKLFVDVEIVRQIIDQLLT